MEVRYIKITCKNCGRIHNCDDRARAWWCGGENCALYFDCYGRYILRETVMQNKLHSTTPLSDCIDVALGYFKS